MKTKTQLLIAALAGAALLPAQSQAQVIFSQDFEAATPGNFTAGPGNFVQVNTAGGGFQVQGGCGGGTVSLLTGVDNSGVGFSQGLYAIWDASAASSYTYMQETTYGSVSAPGAGFGLANIKVELDIYMSGSPSVSDPIGVDFQNNGNDYTLHPTLVDGDFTHVSFTLDQATASNGNAFDPTMNSNFQVNYGANGFGFNAGIAVTIDNVVISVVPEPGSLTLVGLSTVGLWLFRRRRA